MSLKEVQDLLNKIMKKNETKPKINIVEDLKTTTKGMKQIVKMSSKEFPGFKEFIKKRSELIFYIAAGIDEIVYVMVIFKKSIPIEYPGIKCFKGFNSYWESITWLWKHATYMESYGFILGDELRKNTITADQVLDLTDEEARSTLSLYEYTLYKELKK